MVERNTHLLAWLEDGYTSCQHGSKEWAENYLHNARDVIVDQDTRIAQLERDLAEARAEIERMTPQFVAYEYLESPAGREIAEAERDRLAAVFEAAKRWWEDKRPARLSEVEHKQHPGVNCIGEIERNLAAAIVASLQTGEQGE